jgi:uncharacterized protein
LARTPKPGVAGSIPAGRTIKKTDTCEVFKVKKMTAKNEGPQGYPQGTYRRQKSMRDLKPYIDQLQYLYRQIPAFKCPKKCRDCCGPIFFTGLEWFLVDNKKMARDNLCPYALKTGCEIYERRPMICRLFGAVDEPRLTCSFGCGPAFRLSEAHGLWLLAQGMRISEAAGFYGVDNSNQMIFNMKMGRPTTLKLYLADIATRKK